MKDEILKAKVNKMTTYTDQVTPEQWVSLVEELASEINSLESEIDSMERNEVYE